MTRTGPKAWNQKAAPVRSRRRPLSMTTSCSRAGRNAWSRRSTASFPKRRSIPRCMTPRATLPAFAAVDVRTSFLQRSLLSSRRLHKFALGLYPTAFEQFDLTAYDLVISSSSAFAKGVITNPETCHICYCHTPARFAWRQHEYLQQGRLTRLLAPLLRGMLSDLRRWDFDSAQRVDYFVANSHNVAEPHPQVLPARSGRRHLPAGRDEALCARAHRGDRGPLSGRLAAGRLQAH